jgi:fructokinase
MARPLIVGIGEVLWDMLPAGKQLGGAPANFAYHANALGARGAVVSRVGDDDPGREILARLDALGVDRSHVSVDPHQPTGTVDVRVDAAGVPTYVIHEGVAWDFLAADDALLDLARRADAVCFGTLAQRSRATRDAIRSFLRATRPSCVRVCDINLRQSYFSRELIEQSLATADVLKLNDGELPVVVETLGIEAEGAASVRQLLPRYPVQAAVRELFRRFPLRVVALTRGGHGSVLVDRAGRVSEHEGLKVETLADTVGAGDAFTAALVMGLLANRDLDRINAVANRLAAYVCTQPGATPAMPPDLVAAVK